MIEKSKKCRIKGKNEHNNRQKNENARKAIFKKDLVELIELPPQNSVYE